MSSTSNAAFWDAQPEAVFRTVTTRPGEFARLMSSLVDPNAPSKAVYNYVITLKDRFLRRGGLIRLGGKTPGFDDFEKLAIQSGIVETLFKIARGTGKTMEEVFTTYFAAEALWKLIVIGSPSEKKDLLKKYMEHHVVEYCVENAQGGAFIAHRVIGMLGLRILSQECYLADHLSVEKTSEVMKTCCECMLLGPDLFVRQLRDPATTWQSLFCFGNTEVNPKKAARHAPRYYATFQENAIWTIYEFVSRLPFPGQDYYNNLMKHDPALLDLLLRCCNVPREAHYAESEVDSSALTVLVLMMHLPVEMVPGLKIEVPVQSVKDRLERRWDGVMEAAGLIATHSKWRQHFVDVWQRLESEKVDEISRMMMEAQKKYHAQFPFEEEALDLVIQYRGKYSIAKVSLMRLIATMAFASERTTDITNEDLLNLLPITRAVCQPELNKSEDPNNPSAYEENHRPSFSRSPMERVHGASKCEEIVQVNEMVVEGPTSHMRLLVSLAKRGVPEQVAQWCELPTGISVPGGLSKLKEYLSDEEIKRCLSVGVQALAKRREKGNATFRDDKDINEARFEYWSAAMLGAALLEFDEITKGKYSQDLPGVRKEMVMSLGNAAEMSLALQYFDRALIFASAAVDIAGKCSTDEVDQKVREKNERRVKRAEEGVAGKQ